ncbi:MAG: AraC family transcriptional regulator [Ferruginibacter sp.]
MTLLNVHHTDYKELLHDLAAKLGIAQKPGDDYLKLQPPAGEGIMKSLSLFNDLKVMLVDARFTGSLTTIRHRSDSRYFILHFDDVYISNTALVKVDDETLQKTNTRHSVARLTSNLFQNIEELPANLHIKSVKVLFNEEWLKKYMGLDADADVVKRYLSLKTESFHIEPLDPDYLKLMEELWNAEKDDPLQNIFLQNRVTLLIERFFSRLYSKSNLLEGKFDLTSDTINRLITVEKMLVADFSKLPPTIDQFSKIVSMSSTSLKKGFKTMYGDSIYSYYQKQRLQKAKELLLSGKFNVRQTAEAIGYTNVSNFTSAFKKQFKNAPGTAIPGQ